MARRRRKPSRFKKTVFRNGLTLLTERQPEFRSLSIGIWVKIGTRHERARETGVSHFLEHMLFKGTEKRSALEIVREVDQVGGEFNAFTGREYTCFHILLLDRDLDLGMDVLCDALLNSTFDAEEMERERKVILQEIQMVEENPEELAHDLYFELIYGRHPLGKPILGTESSMRRMSRGEIMRYFKRNYVPEEIIVSVVGDVSHEAVKARIKPLIRGQWPGRTPGAHKRPQMPGTPAMKPGFWWIKRDTEQVHIVWGVEGPKYGSKDRFAAYLLNIYLGGGMSSELFQEIREKKGLAYNVYSSLTSHHDGGVFSIYVATGMKQVPLCLKLIEECAAKLRRELLEEEELRIIKDNLKGTILLESDNVESRMQSIARNEIYFGQYVSIEQVCEAIDAVTPQDIRRVARKLLGQSNRSILALGPRPSPTVRSKLRPQFPKRFQK